VLGGLDRTVPTPVVTEQARVAVPREAHGCSDGRLRSPLSCHRPPTRLRGARRRQAAAPAGVAARRPALDIASARPMWDVCGAWGENPSIHKGLRQDQRLLKTGVAALGDDLDDRVDQPLAESLGFFGSPVTTGARVGLGVA
jgi:hypothetical protein